MARMYLIIGTCILLMGVCVFTFINVPYLVKINKPKINITKVVTINPYKDTK